jgi:hypothetical protein
MSEAFEWIKSGGWAGWLEDQLTGEVITSEGDTFKSADELKKYLSDLPTWPRPDRQGQRRIPKRRAAEKIDEATKF